MANLKTEDIKAINDKMAEIEQFSPLFAEEPDEEMYTNVTGTVTEVTIGTNTFNSLELKSVGANAKTSRIPIVRGAESKSKFNVGIFTALRDFVSAAGKVYTQDETQRVFAY